MKRYIILIILILLVVPFNTNAKTLRDLKNELAALETKKAKNDADKSKTQSEINSINKNIELTANKITESENTIKKLNSDIVTLNENIKQKDLEIKEILHFIQISNGENSYLEYIFGAKDITDFIFRAAISEQLVSYNDSLMDEYNDMIIKCKETQVKLTREMEDLERKQQEYQTQLSSLGNSLKSMMDVSMDINEEINNAKKIVKYYEVDLKCKLDENINNCGSIPYSGTFIRPLVSGRITSVFGMRCYTRNNGQYYCGMHNGLDLAGGDTKIYAAAPGLVVGRENYTSCGGNKIYIIHNIGGHKYTTAYFHVKNVKVKVGDTVDQNTVIATMGGGPDTWSYDTCTTGQHLHFSVLTGHYLRDYTAYSQYESHNINPASVVNFPPYATWFSNRITRY